MVYLATMYRSALLVLKGVSEFFQVLLDGIV